MERFHAKQNDSLVRPVPRTSSLLRKLVKSLGVEKSMISPSVNSRNPEIGSTDPSRTALSASRQSGRSLIQPRSCGLGLLRRPKATLALLKATYWEWSRDKVPRMGAALAYYTIFSLAPLLVIAIAIAGFVFGPDAVQWRITAQIQGLVGTDSAHAV